MAPKLAESPQSETFAGTPGKDRDAPRAGVQSSLPYPSAARQAHGNKKHFNEARGEEL
jgi:hypothetical protein